MILTAVDTRQRVHGVDYGIQFALISRANFPSGTHAPRARKGAVAAGVVRPEMLGDMLWRALEFDRGPVSVRPADDEPIVNRLDPELAERGSYRGHHAIASEASSRTTSATFG